MAGEDPALRRYRRILVAFVLVAGLLTAALGVWLLTQGRLFYAFLSLCCIGFFVLIAHGYRQDEEEREPRAHP